MSTLHKTKGIILRSVKYGETSLVVTVFTETLGVQSYLVNGVRTVSKKGASKASLFQPAAMLDLVAYHNEFKNLQRLKEYRWNVLYQHLLSDVIKNAVALFMIELLGKCLKQPEPHPELFYFVEDTLMHLDIAGDIVTANFPLFFAVHLSVFFGFRFSDEQHGNDQYLDLQEGSFTDEMPLHAHYLQDREAKAVSHILKVRQPEELKDLALNQESRRLILQALEDYYRLHVPDFGSLRTLPVLREVMS